MSIFLDDIKGYCADFFFQDSLSGEINIAQYSKVKYKCVC